MNGKIPTEQLTTLPTTVNATAFGSSEEQLKVAQQALVERGFTKTGKTTLYSGITGRMLGTYLNNMEKSYQEIEEDWGAEENGAYLPPENKLEMGVDFEPAQVTVGVISYKALKHVVKEKLRARDIGKNNVLTGQAIKGKSKDGLLSKVLAIVVNKITASLYHRRQHDQTQGKPKRIN
jgi:hypothetical protein